MDKNQRGQLRDLVVEAMQAKSWSATTTAKNAGISTTTMTKITRADKVGPGSVAKVRQALGIDSLAKAQNEAGYSMDIELVRDVIGLWLRDIPQDQRAAKAGVLIKAIVSDKDNQS